MGKGYRWQPRTKAQALALNSRAEILLFGGAAGSLKTETLLMDALDEVCNPNLNAIIFRESYPQLADIIRKSKRLFSTYPFLGRYNAQEHIWDFPENLGAIRRVKWEAEKVLAKGQTPTLIPPPVYGGGATLKFGYLGADDDCDDHQGQEYSFIGFDESTHHTEHQIRYLLSRLRSTDPTLRCRMRLATNPGGISHDFHMGLFIGNDCPHCHPDSPLCREPFKIYDDAMFRDGTPLKHTTQFIPGKVTDHTLFADPKNPDAGNEPYIRKLHLQNPALAKALEEGCWKQFKDQYFTCFDENRGRDMGEDYEGPDMRMVIDYAEAPIKWWYPHFTGTDWGFGGSQAASYLFARTPADEWFENGRIYVLKEYNAPETDVDDYAREFVRRFVGSSWDEEEEERRLRIVASYLGKDSWSETAKKGTEHTIAGQLNKVVEPYGIEFVRANTDRDGGWQLLYRMLKQGEMVICGDTCPELLRAIPSRKHDPKKPDDIIKMKGDPLDDAVDAWRYGGYSFITAGDVHKPVAVAVAEKFEIALKGKTGAARDNAMTMMMAKRRNLEQEAEEEAGESDEPIWYTNYRPMWWRRSRKRLALHKRT